MIKISNLTSSRGNKVPNQFLLEERGEGWNGNFRTRRTFQSYDSVIAVITYWEDKKETVLDENFWDYSVTTGKYRNKFLREDKKTTETKIKTGEYKLDDLNK